MLVYLNLDTITTTIWLVGFQTDLCFYFVLFEMHFLPKPYLDPDGKNSNKYCFVQFESNLVNLSNCKLFVSVSIKSEVKT